MELWTFYKNIAHLAGASMSYGHVSSLLIEMQTFVFVFNLTKKKHTTKFAFCWQFSMLFQIIVLFTTVSVKYLISFIAGNVCFTFNQQLGNYCCMLSTAGSSVYQVWEPRVRVHGAPVRAGKAWTGSPARLFPVSVVWSHTDSGRAVCVQVSAHRTAMNIRVDVNVAEVS